MSIASPGIMTGIAAALRSQTAQEVGVTRIQIDQEGTGLADSHLEALGPQEVIYDATATPAEGRTMLLDQINALLDKVEEDSTYAGLAVDVIYDKETSQLLCIRLVPVDVLSEGAEPSRRIGA